MKPLDSEKKTKKPEEAPAEAAPAAPVHKENDEEKLHLLMVDPHIPAGAKMY